MTVTPTEQVKRSPNWEDHLGKLLGHTGDTSGVQMFPAGTKTMRHKEMDSANRRHSQSIAQADRGLANQYRMHSEKLALDRWNQEQHWAYTWATFEAAQEAAKEAAANIQGGGIAEALQNYAYHGDVAKIGNWSSLAGMTNAQKPTVANSSKANFALSGGSAVASRLPDPSSQIGAYQPQTSQGQYAQSPLRGTDPSMFMGQSSIPQVSPEIQALVRAYLNMNPGANYNERQIATLTRNVENNPEYYRELIAQGGRGGWDPFRALENLIHGGR